MTGEQIAALVGAVVMCLGNVSGLIVVWKKLAEQKLDRALTKEARDADSQFLHNDNQELHDAVQKAVWDIQLLKDNAQHRDTLIEDLQKQINALNSTLAVTNTQLHTLVDAIRELKEK